MVVVANEVSAERKVVGRGVILLYDDEMSFAH